MEKMRGMKGILTSDEERVLEILERNYKKAEEGEEKEAFNNYIKGFAAAMKYVGYQMRTLPGEEFLEKLDGIL